jgi:hypothetical protein
MKNKKALEELKQKAKEKHKANMNKKEDKTNQKKL